MDKVTFHRAVQGKSFMELGHSFAPPFVSSEWHTAYRMNALVPRLFKSWNEPGLERRWPNPALSGLVL
jgi:hypothetical protein